MSDEEMEPFVTALDGTSAEPDPDFVVQLRERVQAEAAASTDSPITQTDDLGEPVMTKLDVGPTEESEADGPGGGWWSRLNTSLVAAGVILLVGVITVGIISLQGDDDGGSVITTDDSDPDTAEPDATDTESFGETPALATVDAYFAAHNAGDLDAVLALFTADATFEDNWTETAALPGWEPRLAWDLASEETLTVTGCAVVDGSTAPTVSIACDYVSRSAVEVAAGIEISITATMTVTEDGITNLLEDVGLPDYSTAGGEFDIWMAATHPEDNEAADCCEGATVEESIARGELRAQYAKEWGDYLEANDCVFSQGC